MKTVTDLSDAGLDPEGDNPNSPSTAGGLLTGNDNPTFYGDGCAELAAGLVGTDQDGVPACTLTCLGEINVSITDECMVVVPANFGLNSNGLALNGIEIFVDGVLIGDVLSLIHI